MAFGARHGRGARDSKEARDGHRPVQLIVLGFDHPEFHGEIIAELERLKESGTVRVIDALAVHKDAAGEIEVAHLSTLSNDEAIARAGGYRISDGFISPLDLVDIGLVSSEEARELHLAGSRPQTS